MLTFAEAAVEIHNFAAPSAAVSALVALLALVFAALALRARRRRPHPALSWVAVAFILFAFKNLFSAAMVLLHIVPHDAIELILSVFDLALILLLFLPFVLRRRG